MVRFHPGPRFHKMTSITQSGQDHIRVRANLAVLDDHGRILLVPHFLDNDEVCWYVPGGGVEFGEKLKDAAKREFKEETGLESEVLDLLDVFEIIELEKPWHSIAITFKGKVIGGKLTTEEHHTYGHKKKPRWFSKDELIGKAYRPVVPVNLLLDIKD